MTKGFLKHYSWGRTVGAADVSNKDHPYHGPVASVTYDETWLTIETDDYEGSAMLNIEALPYLRRALAEISRDIRAKRKDKPLADRGSARRSEQK